MDLTNTKYLLKKNERKLLINKSIYLEVLKVIRLFRLNYVTRI